MSDEKPFDRRRFFREGLREFLRPLKGRAEPIERVIHEIGRLERPANTVPAGPAQSPGPPAAELAWLRPPGSLPEQRFRETCSRCGECVRVCPAQCIKIDPTGELGAGAPYIDAEAMPCVVCDGLHCMQHCPSGALVPTLLAQIEMGIAMWREELCLRTGGEACTLCVDRCPLGSAAIRLDAAGRVEVIDKGCIGCGVCVHACPTSPKSMVSIPRSARPPAGLSGPQANP